MGGTCRRRRPWRRRIPPALGRRRRPAHPRTDEATGSIRLNIRGKDGKVKITKTVRLKDLEGTWTDVDVAAARGEGEGAAAGGYARRVARRRISPLCRRRVAALAVLSLAGAAPRGDLLRHQAVHPHAEEAQAAEAQGKERGVSRRRENGGARGESRARGVLTPARGASRPPRRGGARVYNVNSKRVRS